MVDDIDIAEMERLAKRLLTLCEKMKQPGPVDDPRQARLRASRLTPERQAELRAQMRKRLQRKGVPI